MKQSTPLGRLLLVSLCVILGLTARSQAPTYELYVTNQSQVTSKIYQFDVYLLKKGTSALELSFIQFGLGFDTSIVNGGTLSISFVSGSSQLNTAQTPSSFSVGTTTTTVNGVVYRFINQAAKPSPGAGIGTIISSIKNNCVSPGTRIGTYRLTNTVDFRNSSTCKHIFNTGAGTGRTNTAVGAYVSSANTTLTGTNMGYESVGTCDQNILLNTCNVSASFTTTAAVCYGGANGTASITLSGVGAFASGTYELDSSGVSVAYSANPFVVSGLSAGNHKVSIKSGTGLCPVANNFTISQPASALSSSFSNTACNYYRLPWGGDVINDTVVSHVYTTSKGCDSTVTARIKVRYNTNSVSSVTIACSSYTWNGVTYTTSGTYSKWFTNIAGCDSTAILNLTINSCLNVKLFLEGSYIGNRTMIATLNNRDLGPISTDPTATDSITISLWKSDSLNKQRADYSFKTILHSNGNANITLPSSVIGNDYYIVINHRNSIETWSANPVQINSTVNYDFTTSQSQAYGDGVNSSMKYMGSGVYAIYGGDVNQDGTIDILDLQWTENDASNFAFGYNASDCNGDGSSDGFDIQILENNASIFIYYARPY